MGMGFGSDAKKWEDHFFFGNKIVSKSREQLSKKIKPQPQDRKPATTTESKKLQCNNGCLCLCDLMDL